MRRIWVGLACGVIALSLIELRSSAVAQGKKPVVWLVRHADKDKPPRDDELLPEGVVRAGVLAKQLANEGIALVITSDANRTKATAQPLVDELKKAGKAPTVEGIVGVKAVADKVRASKDNVLVVHHSDTLPKIIKELRKAAPKQALCGFDRLYKLDMNASPPVLTAQLYGAKSAGCPPLAAKQ